MSHVARREGADVRAPKGDAKAVPPDISKGPGPTEANKDFGAVNVDVQTDTGPTTTYETTARTMPRRRSRLTATKAPARPEPPKDLIAALEMGEQLDAPTLFQLIQALLRY